MKQDIRLQTAVVVMRGTEYLVGFSVFLRWSTSIYDAWRTRDIKAAQTVAARVAGTLVLFNPVTGQRRDYKGGC